MVVQYLFLTSAGGVFSLLRASSRVMGDNICFGEVIFGEQGDFGNMESEEFGNVQWDVRSGVFFGEINVWASFLLIANRPALLNTATIIRITNSTTHYLCVLLYWNPDLVGIEVPLGC